MILQPFFISCEKVMSYYINPALKLYYFKSIFLMQKVVNFQNYFIQTCPHIYRLNYSNQIIPFVTVCRCFKALELILWLHMCYVYKKFVCCIYNTYKQTQQCAIYKIPAYQTKNQVLSRKLFNHQLIKKNYICIYIYVQSKVITYVFTTLLMTFLLWKKFIKK